MSYQQEPLASALVVYIERKISDPMQRAGLRLLSSAVVPIQAVVRCHSALRRALPHCWQSSFCKKHLRGYLARRDFKAARKAAIAVQRVYQGGTVRHQMLLEHCCAMEIQRHVRGLLASLYVFEQVHMITMVQACVRRKQAMDTAMNGMVAVIHIQSIFRGAVVRSRQGRTVAAATKVQTAWRCFSGRFNYQLDLLDIIIVQSVWRRRIAQNAHRGLVFAKREKSAVMIQARGGRTIAR
jgi:myosin heavy subunit